MARRLKKQGMPSSNDRAKALVVKFAYKHLPILLRRQVLYRAHQGYWPPLRKPQTLNEKINWRVLFDHRPVLAWTCDKLAMKEEALARTSDVSVPSTLWSGDDVNEIEAVQFPDRWILKPNHRSEFVYFGRGAPNMAEVRKATTGWLDEQNMTANGEWAYGQARRTIFAEQAIGPVEGPPSDYKFFVFDGTVRLIQVEHGRFSEKRSRQFYRPDWTLAGGREGMAKGEPTDKPETLNEMLRIASEIAHDFDFLRVDLYDIDGKVFFGEVSPYPASGHGKFDPPSLDQLLGSYWKLPARKHLKAIGGDNHRGKSLSQSGSREEGRDDSGLVPEHFRDSRSPVVFHKDEPSPGSLRSPTPTTSPVRLMGQEQPRDPRHFGSGPYLEL